MLSTSMSTESVTVATVTMALASSVSISTTAPFSTVGNQRKLSGGT